MTLEDLERVPGEILTCAQVAPILKANPGTIHQQAVEAQHFLGFPVVVVGSRVKIPKRPFIDFMMNGRKTGGQKHE